MKDLSNEIKGYALKNAIEFGKTDAGKIKNLSNNFGDAQEQIGGSVAKITAYFADLGNTILSSVTSGNALTDVFVSVYEEVKGLFTTIGNLIGLFGETADKTSIVEAVFKTLSVTLSLSLAPIRLIIWGITKLIDLFIFGFETFVKINKIIYEFATSFDFVNVAINKVSKGFDVFKSVSGVAIQFVTDKCL